LAIFWHAGRNLGCSLDSLLPHQVEPEARMSNKFARGQQSVLAELTGDKGMRKSRVLLASLIVTGMLAA
jgi:hypothetical protein